MIIVLRDTKLFLAASYNSSSTMCKNWGVAENQFRSGELRYKRIAMMKKCFLLTLLSLMCTALFAQERLALVIGNSAYTSNPLKNPVNDAADMSAVLTELGFSVTTLVDADKRQTIQAVRDFGNSLNRDSTGLFYYSGHGAQVSGQNYIIPVDADIQSQDELEYFGVPVDLLMSKMEQSRNQKNIIILDSCRDNPYPGYARSGEKGLAIVRVQPPESMIIYSTSPGKTAGDNPAGRNGFFTAALLSYIREPGLEVDDLMKLVTAETTRMNRNQVPWRNSSMTSNFFFGDPAGAPSAAAALDGNRPDLPAYTAASSLDEAVLSTYSGEHSILGQAIKDPSLAGTPVIMAAPVPGGSYQWQMGGASGSQTILDGRFQLFAKDITDFTSTVQGRSAVVLVLSRGSDSREFTLSYRPSEIYAWQDLQAMRQNTAGAYTQMADISFPDADGDGLGDHNFQPIAGSVREKFTGTFDGSGHRISRLYISRPAEDHVGLFGRTGNKARITDIVLEDVYVEGRKKVGAAVGEARTSLPEGSFTGEVRQEKGKSGGLVGSSKSHELSAGFVARSDFSLYSLSYSSIVGGSIHYARNFSRNWAWTMGFSAGTNSTDMWVELSTGVRYKTAWAIPVNVYGCFDFGMAHFLEVGYFPFDLGLGVRVAPEKRWFIDIGGALSILFDPSFSEFMPTGIFQIQTGFLF